MRRRTSIMLFMAAAAALTACALYKPARVIAPQAFGLKCSTQDICIEDQARLAEATSLRNDALGFVEKNVGALVDAPRLIFCSTRDCFARFGDPRIRGQIVWGYGAVVINEHGWDGHILRHEIIHQWQAETFGIKQAAYGLPRWFIEGMAYSLSNDPRHPIPRAEAEGYRVAFDQWLSEGNDWRVPPK